MPDISAPIAALASTASSSDQLAGIMDGVRGLIAAYWPLIIVPLGLFLAMLFAESIFMWFGHWRYHD